MSISWRFIKAHPGARARESQVEKFFNSDVVANRANAIVREGIQNSLDAGNGEAVRVRIAIGRWNGDETRERLPRYMTGFVEHFDVPAVQKKLVNPPQPIDQFRYLVFEDFGTSGLLGDPTQWWPDDEGPPNPFFNYFRGEGISDKLGGKRGRHGVGRLVFMFASRIHSVFGLTRRSDDARQLLMGTSVLRNHRVDDVPYLPDGWFGLPGGAQEELTLPIEKDAAFLAQFKKDFGVSRGDGESGLSVVVPWLGEDVTENEVLRSVAAGYFYPILKGVLSVDVEDATGKPTRITAETLDAVVDSMGTDAAKVKPLLKLAKASLAANDQSRLLLPGPAGGAPKWSGTVIPDDLRGKIQGKIDAGEPVLLRAPVPVRRKSESAVDSFFDICLERDPLLGEGQIIFIREGIVIADVRPRRTPGVRALVVVDGGPLATFLGDAENPAHTQWQRELVRDAYFYHGATIDYVVLSVPSVLGALSDAQKKPDTSLLLDLFSLPTEDDSGPKVKRQKKKGAGGEPDDTDVDVERAIRRFVIDKSTTGFTVRSGDVGAVRPPMLAIKAAYGVRRGSPFAKYDPSDFRFGLGGVECTFEGCESADFDDNWMVLKIIHDDFKFSASGFDTNRDLHVDVKIRMDEEVKEGEVADAAAA